MYLIIQLLPLLSSKLSTNRNNGNSGRIQAVFNMFKSSICCIIIFYEVGYKGSGVILNMGNWIDKGNLLVEWSMSYDSLTVTKYLPIVIISFLIQKYSLEYKGHDPHISRFFALLSLFTFTMLIQVSGDNLFILLVG